MAKICLSPNCQYTVFSKGLCKRHWAQAHGKPIKRAAINVNTNSINVDRNRQRKPIKKISVKRLSVNKKYSLLRKEYLADNPTCAIQRGNCTRIATDIHHKKGRIGKLLLDVTYWLGACRICHDWAEKNPAEAKLLGFSVNRNTIT